MMKLMMMTVKLMTTTVILIMMLTVDDDNDNNDVDYRNKVEDNASLLMTKVTINVESTYPVSTRTVMGIKETISPYLVHMFLMDKSHCRWNLSTQAYNGKAH